MTHGSRKMIFAVFLLIAAVCLQDAAVFAQQQPPFGYQAQGWNPQPWATPYLGAAANSWMDYIKPFQQLYSQWDKTGAANMFALGMQYAQQAAKELEKAAAQQQAKVPFF